MCENGKRKTECGHLMRIRWIFNGILCVRDSYTSDWNAQMPRVDEQSNHWHSVSSIVISLVFSARLRFNSTKMDFGELSSSNKWWYYCGKKNWSFISNWQSQTPSSFFWTTTNKCRWTLIMSFGISFDIQEKNKCFNT